jgi:predicted transcriptional regulator
MSVTVRSVSFPPDVFRELTALALEQKRPRSRVLVDAVKRYHRIWSLEKQQERGRRYAKKMGVQSETDIERLLNK